MKWIEPPEKDFKELENRLWNAADQLRANSNLTAVQYSQPVLGLIVLRFADTRFSAQRSKLDETTSTSRRAAPAIDVPRASAGDDGRWSLHLDGVADGRHAYVATATDASGNVSTASAERIMVVDPIASFHVDAELEATLQCRLDSGQSESCTRTPSYSALRPGRHVFEVRAVGAAGNVGIAASVDWTVDEPITPPVVTPTGIPPWVAPAVPVISFAVSRQSLATARVKRAALTLTVSAPDAKPVTRNVTLTRG